MRDTLECDCSTLTTKSPQDIAFKSNYIDRSLQLMHREGINLDFTMYVDPSKLTLIMDRYHHEGITQPRIINEINVKYMKSNFTPVM